MAQRLITIALLGAAACAPREEGSAFTAVWVKSLYGAIRAERLSPPVASRLMVYSTAALYTGLASDRRDMPSLARSLNGFPAMTPSTDHDGPLAAVWAERVVLDSLLQEALPTTRAALHALADSLAAAREALLDESKRVESERAGRAIGIAIVRWSRQDRFAETRGRAYVPAQGPGLWRNDAPASTYASQNMSGASEYVAFDNPANLLQAGRTSDRGLVLNRPKRSRTLPPVNMAGASEPFWAELRPFVLSRWDDCGLAPPPVYADTGAFRREAEAVIDAQSRLTPEHQTIAYYWADNAGESGTPVGHWLSIASQAASHRGLDAANAARLLVMAASAQADAFIASWGYKYRHNVLRPRAFIRAHIDTTWEPLIPTPPFPEYPSGHSTQSAAAAEVLTSLLGEMPFDDSTAVSIGHSVRRFPSFRAAAEEAGMSRVYGGIHFPVGNAGGRALGECIGRRVVGRFDSAR